MKVTKTCPKCGSKDLVRFDGYCGNYSSGNYIATSALGRVNVNSYVCCSCGYVEQWIDKEDINKVKNGSRAKKV